MKLINWLWSLVSILIIPTLVACSQALAVPTTSIAQIVTKAPSSTIMITQVPTATTTPTPIEFNKTRAFQDVEKQVNFGPRLPGSQAHNQVVDWLIQSLEMNEWSVDVQETTYQNQPVRNVIAKRGIDKNPWIILGAHYDSRFVANRDPNPDYQLTPVPGANDGASGVAVLLELARILPKNLDIQVWLVFFDAEDQGQIDGWDWILGSRAFVSSLVGTPDSVVIIDMIGDSDLLLPQERNSDPALNNEIWKIASQRGHSDIFIPQAGPSILDDHTPFLEKGIRAIDIIDFNYQHWHTTGDTPDKVSPDSLFVVGDTLLHWLLSQNTLIAPSDP